MTLPGSDQTIARRPGDRFLAFAFAAGDLLLEVDSHGVIVFSRGTSPRLLDRDPAELDGKPLADAVVPDQRRSAEELLNRLRETGRVREVAIDLQSRDGAPRRFAVSGILLPDHGGVCNLVLSRRHFASVGIDRTEMSAEEFGDEVRRALTKGRQIGQDYNLSLVDIGAATKAQGLDGEVAREYEAAAMEALRAWAVPDGPLARLDDGKIGLLHDSDIPRGSLGRRVNDLIRNLTGRADLTVQTATIDAAAAGLSEADVSKALTYTIKRFMDDGVENLDGGSLTDGYQAAMASNLERVQSIRCIIDSSNFTLYFQPIVDLHRWSLHHFEALARIRQGDDLVPPGAVIGFAEEVGIITEFDQKVCRKSIATLRDNDHIPVTARIAINLSGRSVMNRAFMGRMISLLRENEDICPRLLVEVTEYTEIKDLAAVNKTLNEVRMLGCEVCIDDFGAGAATFQYLAGLKVDYVKIDGQYIRDAFTKPEGRPFLKAIAGLCNDLKIRTIGEMVEDEKTVWLLRDLGVDYAQGHYFGKAEPDQRGFRLRKGPRISTF